MAIAPVVATYGSLVEVEEIGNSRESILNLLESQKTLFHSQINELRRIVDHQRKLTGTNPLTQDMAASSWGYKTGKRIKDTLNPKAMTYLQSVFSIKDTIGKKETREISALCRMTVTQVRDYFNAERSKVKKLVQKSERIASDISRAVVVGCSPNQTQFSVKNMQVTNITPHFTPDNMIIENCTTICSNDGVVASTSPQSPFTLEDTKFSSTENVVNSSSFIPGFTWDSEKSGNVIIPWNSEIHRNTEYSQTENLEKSFQENAGKFDDLYTPLSWCPGNIIDFSTNAVKASTVIPTACTDTTDVNLNTSNDSRNISNVSTNITNAGVKKFESNANASSVQDGQLPINTDPMRVGGGNTPGVDSTDREFVERIFSMMRKEQTFSGQVKLMEWVLQIQNKAVLSWFSIKGGITILASWLNDAALEEQTSVLPIIFKVFCHMPLDKAQPAQMSDILQTVNKLRFYRNPDISKRAKVLLSSWSKMFVRSQQLKNARNRLKNGPLAKRKNGALYDKPNLDIPEEIYAFAQDSEDHGGSELGPGNELKLLTSSSDTSSKKQEPSISVKKTKERRKVQLVEHPDSKLGRNPPTAKAGSSNQSRPLSADDIKKAKQRALYMQEKHGKANSPTENVRLKDSNTPPAARKPLQNNQSPSTSNAPQPPRLRINEITKSPQERLLEKVTRVQIQWCRPPEVELKSEWQVCSGQNSKEVQTQTKRTQREQESIYQNAHQIPPNPKEPWDSEMDYDDTLTPLIPTEVPPSETDSPTDANTTTNEAPPPVPDFTQADPELLKVLLKHPELVAALTSQGQNLAQEQLSALIEMVKKADSTQPVPVSKPVSVPRPVPIVVPEPEAQHYSLPSPTPPDDALRSNWRSEFPSHVNAVPFTSQNMPLAISNSNSYISRNLDYATQQQPPSPNIAYQATRMHENLMPSNHYQANDTAQTVQKPYVQYPEQPTVVDYPRREYGQQPNSLNYYYANPNNPNNVNAQNMYSRRNEYEYAPRVGPPEMYGRGTGHGRSSQNYGNRAGEKRWRDAHGP